MSSVASLHALKISDLPTVVSAAGSGRFWDALDQVGEEAEEYNWSGYVMLNVLLSLDDLNVSLESPSLHAASRVINADFGYNVLITSDAKAFLDRLDPAVYEPGVLLDGPSQLDLDDEEAGYALEDTLSLLRNTIARLSDDEVLLVHIG